MSHCNMKKEKILISACLLEGGPWRYDGKTKYISDPKIKALLDELLKEDRLIPVCPEVVGGLEIPRPPAEIQGRGETQGGRKDQKESEPRGRLVVNKQGIDVTSEYLAGAEEAFRIAKEEGVTVAILKEKGPSCGKNFIYDGSFTGTLVPGEGITAELLREAGVRIFNEKEVEKAIAFLEDEDRLSD